VVFVEQPDAASAQRHVDSGEYLWNAGIFMKRDTLAVSQSRLVVSAGGSPTPELSRPSTPCLRRIDSACKGDRGAAKAGQAHRRRCAPQDLLALELLG
jgi:hypothetical protein